jgi:hypothetical protein
MLAALALVATTATGATVQAQSCEDGSPNAYFKLSVGDDLGLGCKLNIPSGPVTIYVRVYANPFEKVRFQLPDPPYGTVIGESWAGSTSGNRNDGLEIDMGTCAGPGDAIVGALTLLVMPGEIDACAWWSVAVGCEVQDCSGEWHLAKPVQHEVGPEWCLNCCWQCCWASLAPYDLFPPDGATGVPLHVEMSWKTSQDVASNPPYSGCSVRISTDPACNSGTSYAVNCETLSFVPDFLEPNTTYYWRASWYFQDGGCSDGLSGFSPWYSFTMEPPSSTESKTWAATKSLYR